MSDHDANFDNLIRPQLGALYRFAFRLTGTRSDAEDLVQDTLVKVYRRRDELSGIRELKPWLGRVLFNQFVDDKRRYARRTLHLVDPNADPDAIAADDGGPEALSSSIEVTSKLQTALERLSEDHRVVLLLHDAEGYKLQEIQEVTGTPVGTLKSRLHRARARLREIIESDGTFSDAATCNGVDGAKTDAL